MLPSQQLNPQPRLLRTTSKQNIALATIPDSEVDPSFVTGCSGLDNTACNSWRQQQNNLTSGSDDLTSGRNDGMLAYSWGAPSHRQGGPALGQPDAAQYKNLGPRHTDEPSRDDSERCWGPGVRHGDREPEPGVRALHAVKMMHDSNHALYEVSISGEPIVSPSTAPSPKPSVAAPGALDPSTRASLTASWATAPSTVGGEAPATAAEPAPGTAVSHVPPTPEELRDAIPHSSALYCRQHHGWVIFAVTAASATACHISAYWCADPEEKYLLDSLPDTTPRASKPCSDNTDTDRNTAKFGWNCQAPPEKKMHHLHKYPNAVVGSGGYATLRQEVLSPTGGPHIIALPKSGEGADTELGTQGTQSEVQDDNNFRSGWERASLLQHLDLYLCCQCRTQVLCSPAGSVIPGIIPSSALERYIHERTSNPNAGQSNEQSAFASLELMLRIVEEPLWLGNQHYLALTGKVFTTKIGWSESSRQIFDAMGFTVENSRLIPPSLETTTPEGRAARSRLLRVWVELGAVLADYCLRYSKIAPSRNNCIRLTKSRLDDPISEHGKHKMTLNEVGSTCFNQDTFAPHAPPPQPTAGINANRGTPRSIQLMRRGTFSSSHTSAHYDDGPSARTAVLAMATKFAANTISINTGAPTPPEGEVGKLRSEFEQMKAKRDMVKSECDRLQVERDEARAEGQKYRVERDETRIESERYRTERNKAVEQCEAVAETCRELRQRIEGLERVLKEKNEKSRQVVELMIASLHAGTAANPPVSSSEAQS